MPWSWGGGASAREARRPSHGATHARLRAAALRSDWDDVNRKKQFAGWDQFTVNEQQFGVKSTYDETLYTTVLDKGKVSREQEAVANKLAAEIEGTAATHAHIAEERGQEIEGNDKYDEEARYSTVLRAGEEGIQAVGAGAGGGGQGGGGAQGADGRSGEARADASASSGAPAAEPAKSKLNPNAKSFVFNPKAKAFVPGGSGSGGARPAMPAVAGQYGCAGFPANAVRARGAGPRRAPRRYAVVHDRRPACPGRSLPRALRGCGRGRGCASAVGAHTSGTCARALLPCAVVRRA